jgi:hypothetical protein
MIIRRIGDTIMDWVVNHTKLAEMIKAADAESATLTQNVIITRMVKDFREKTPLSDAEVRKLCKLALIRYQKGNEMFLQKIAMLDEEEKREALEKLKTYFVNVFMEVISGSSSKLIGQIMSQLDTFFGLESF